MIITKKALPRRTFLRGLGATRGAAAARCHGPVDDRPGAHGGGAGPATRLRLHADGLRSAAVDAAGDGPLLELSPTLQSLAAVADQLTVITNLELKNAYPGHARDLERGVPERGHGEADREHRLPPRHHGRSDRRQADRQPDAAAVARALDGSAPDRRAMRQRLRLRVSEQPVLVVADDPAARRGAPAHRVRAPVRRRGQRDRAPRRAAAPGEPARLGPRRHHPAPEHARARGSHQGRPVSRHGPRSGAAHSEGRGRRPPSSRCRISIVRRACRRRMPITPG